MQPCCSTAKLEGSNACLDTCVWTEQAHVLFVSVACTRPRIQKRGGKKGQMLTNDTMAFESDCSVPEGFPSLADQLPPCACSQWRSALTGVHSCAQHAIVRRSGHSSRAAASSSDSRSAVVVDDTVAQHAQREGFVSNACTVALLVGCTSHTLPHTCKLHPRPVRDIPLACESIHNRSLSCWSCVLTTAVASAGSVSMGVVTAPTVSRMCTTCHAIGGVNPVCARPESVHAGMCCAAT